MVSSTHKIMRPEQEPTILPVCKGVRVMVRTRGVRILMDLREHGSGQLGGEGIPTGMIQISL